MNTLFSLLFIIFWGVWVQASGPVDNRVPAKPNEFPAIGRLYADIDGTEIQVSDKFGDDLNKTIRTSQNQNRIIQYNFCTATVLPQNLILTAAHCYEQLVSYNSVKIKTYFQPSLIGSKPASVSALRMTWKFGKVFNRERLKDDWAVIRLDEKIAGVTPMRFFQLSSVDKDNESVEAVGYPYSVRNEKPLGFTLYKNQCRYNNNDASIKNAFNQSTRKQIQGSDLLDCFVSEGNSGGPLIYKLKVGESFENVIVGVAVAGTGHNLFSKLLIQMTLHKQIAFAAPIDEILEALTK